MKSKDIFFTKTTDLATIRENFVEIWREELANLVKLSETIKIIDRELRQRRL